MSRIESDTDITVSATEFKSKCLDLMKRLDSGKLTRITVTKRGKPMVVVEPARKQKKPLKSIYGFMRDRVRLSPDYDPFEQVIEESEDPFIGKKSRGDAA